MHCVWHLQDFHSAIEGALSDEDYMAELYEAMLEEEKGALERGMELAAQRAVRKAELKVYSAAAAHSVLQCSVWPFL